MESLRKNVQLSNRGAQRLRKTIEHFPHKEQLRSTKIPNGRKKPKEKHTTKLKEQAEKKVK